MKEEPTIAKVFNWLALALASSSSLISDKLDL